MIIYTKMYSLISLILPHPFANNSSIIFNNRNHNFFEILNLILLGNYRNFVNFAISKNIKERIQINCDKKIILCKKFHSQIASGDHFSCNFTHIILILFYYLIYE